MSDPVTLTGADRREIDEVRRLAHPLRTPGDLDGLIDRLAPARYVLLGEASHGTAEFYGWRAAITRRLIAEHGFSFVAVEGDWPDCFAINRWVKARAEGSAREVLDGFVRWPRWMWANTEVLRFVEWLRRHNEHTGASVGFYGLDVYSLWESLEAVLGYLGTHDRSSLDAAQRAFRCFQPYGGDPQRYASAVRMVPDSCEDEVVELLAALRGDVGKLDGDPEAAFDAVQNAEAVRGAERYYRTMVRADEQSWNVRDGHMADTLDRLIEHHRATNNDVRAVVWAHNTHVGDARATDMADAGMLNLGQVVRERHGRHDAALVGFGGHHGSVIAADFWGAPPRRMEVPVARDGSHEQLLHEALGEPAVITFGDEPVSGWLQRRRPHRAIGVVYRSGADRTGNWVPTILGERYDAFVSFDETATLVPLHDHDATDRAELETYPWSV